MEPDGEANARLEARGEQLLVELFNRQPDVPGVQELRRLYMAMGEDERSVLRRTVGEVGLGPYTAEIESTDLSS